MLLVTLAEGAMLDRPLSLKLKKALKDRASPAHVPAVIVALPQLPMTHSGKLSERAARDALRGQTPKNLAALKNPETVDAIREHPELRAG